VPHSIFSCPVTGRANEDIKYKYYMRTRNFLIKYYALALRVHETSNYFKAQFAMVRLLTIRPYVSNEDAMYYECILIKFGIVGL
jgi:hypothetical protein